MRRPALALAIVFLAAAPPGVALARAPTLRELPTVKAVLEAAKKLRAERAAAAAAAARDVKMEKIKAYEQSLVSIDSYRDVLKFLLDEREDDRYRMAAAAAIRTRFREKVGFDRLKKEIARQLLPKLRSREKKVRIWASGILATFWPGKAKLIGYDPEEHNFIELTRKWRKWKDFVEKREKRK